MGRILGAVAVAWLRCFFSSGSSVSFPLFFLHDFDVGEVRSDVYIWFVVNRFRERGGSLRETAEDDKELGDNRVRVNQHLFYVFFYLLLLVLYTSAPWTW
jgi:hypothetical protein